MPMPYDNPQDRWEIIDRVGTVTLEYGPYWRIVRASKSGAMGSGLGSDEVAARERWARLLDQARCRECGDPPFGNWQKDCAAEMESRSLCFWCNSWTNTLAKTDALTAIVDGYYYHVGEEERSIARRCGWPLVNGRLRGDYRHVLGHSGSEFRIRFDDGRVVTTTNLWAGGEIPEHFRDRLPNNAVFLQCEPSGYVGYGSASFAEVVR